MHYEFLRVDRPARCRGLSSFRSVFGWKKFSSLPGNEPGTPAPHWKPVATHPQGVLVLGQDLNYRLPCLWTSCDSLNIINRLNFKFNYWTLNKTNAASYSTSLKINRAVLANRVAFFNSNKVCYVMDGYIRLGGTSISICSRSNCMLLCVCVNIRVCVWISVCVCNGM